MSIDNGFVAYRLPDESDHHVCYIESIDSRNSTTNITNFDFIIAPFDKEGKETYLLKFNNVILNCKLPEVKLFNGTFNDVTEKDYLLTCQALIDKLLQGDISKVVLSRTHSIQTSDINLNELFMNMKAAYPKAFIYIFHHAQIGTWAAATPELLISSDGTITETVALAGTRKYKASVDSQWGSKEIEEHKYIEKFVNQKLGELSIPYTKSETFTQRAGNVEHIKSVYKIELGNHDFISIAENLHPGPAISGYPVDHAMQIISEVESHDRLLYCGFLGPLNHGGNKYFFINLRCMEIFNNGYKMYIGGGITSESIALDEWTETKLKSETLSDMLLSIGYENHQ